MNSLIVDSFAKLLKQIEAEYLNSQVDNEIKEMNMHKHRLQSIKKILAILRKIDFKITSSSDLKNIPGIGKGTLKRIDEILETGSLSELHQKYDKKKQKKIDSIQELENVIGIGSSTARKMVTEYGIRSVKELKKAVKNKEITVSNAVLLGLKYYDVMEDDIPRREVASIEKYLVKQAQKLDPKLEIMICGSYRRGKKTSGDIDVLVYHPDVKTANQITNSDVNTNSYLERLIGNLTEDNFLIDHLTRKNYKRLYMGFCKYKDKPVRRIDMRFIPYASLPTSMLYFTGPYELNTAMRIAAKKRGMILSEYGLYRIVDDDERIPVKIKSEADVFKKLGMKYLTPEQREDLSSGAIKKAKI